MVLLWWHWLYDVECGGGGSLDNEVFDMFSTKYVSLLIISTVLAWSNCEKEISWDKFKICEEWFSGCGEWRGWSSLIRLLK